METKDSDPAGSLLEQEGPEFIVRRMPLGPEARLRTTRGAVQRSQVHV